MQNSDAFSKIEIIDAINFRRKKIAYYTKKRNFNVLSVRLHGEAVFTQNDIQTTVSPQNILFIPKNTGYHQSTEGERVVAIHFHADLPYSEITVLSKGSRELCDLFLETVSYLHMKNDYGYYMAHCRLYEILALAAKNNKSPEFTDKIALGYDEINMNYKRSDLKIEEIAEGIGMSPVYFRREFKNRYGCSPKSFLTELRLKNAALLLENGYSNVSEAAAQSGFSDPNYFSSAFKKHFGIPPLAYSKGKTV